MDFHLIRFIFANRRKKNTNLCAKVFACVCVAFAIFGFWPYGPKNTYAEQPYQLVVLGDSLSAGYGLADQNSFPSVLEQELRQKGYAVNVINAGVSGDTSSTGLARLKWSVPDDADGVIVELGANDALRGLDPEVTYRSLENIILQLQEADQDILLAGMLAPPNLGQDYGQRFAGLYQKLADQYDVLFYPFFLKDVVAQPSLNLDDGIHPNAKGVEVIVRNILPLVEQMMIKDQAKKAKKD
jgi:acyl-CoA thioesterase-1